MPLWVSIPLTVVGSALLWVAGTVVFDAVHWLLHQMLGSRWGLLRLLAWPHGVHHRFLDRSLRTRFEYQRLNIWCHLVPEFLTQLAFSAAMALWLPLPVVAGCVALQVLVFGYLIRFRGLDLNHRAAEILDAYRPSFLCPPAYHALHHVYPNAHYAAYNKLVDWAVGGGAQLRDRRFALVGGETGFGRALAAGLRAEGAAGVSELAAPDEATLRALDVLVICEPRADEVAFVEAFIRATAGRQLPPEVWAVHGRAPGGLARHYYGDLRVCYRALVRPGLAGAAGAGPAAEPDREAEARAARVALFFLRRGLHFVPTWLGPGLRRDFRRFRRSAPRRPPGVAKVPSRAALAAAAA